MYGGASTLGSVAVGLSQLWSLNASHLLPRDKFGPWPEGAIFGSYLAGCDALVPRTSSKPLPSSRLKESNKLRVKTKAIFH